MARSRKTIKDAADEVAREHGAGGVAVQQPVIKKRYGQPVINIVVSLC